MIGRNAQCYSGSAVCRKNVTGRFIRRPEPSGEECPEILRGIGLAQRTVDGETKVLVAACQLETEAVRT